jgi:hypothetical protein
MTDVTVIPMALYFLSPKFSSSIQGVVLMVKHVWYLLGILTGFLLSELWRRQHLERMRYAEGILEEQRQNSIETIKELDALDAQRSTEERIKYAIWDALRGEDNDETDE